MPSDAVDAIPLDRVRDHLADCETGVDGIPYTPLVVVDLDSDAAAASTAAAAIRSADVVTIGVARTTVAAELREVSAALTFTLVEQHASVDRTCVAVPDVDDAARQVQRSVGAAPVAALASRRLLESTSRLPVRDGLFQESAVYSMLLAGAEFARWRAGVERRAVPEPLREAVVLDRSGGELRVRLAVPERRNAYSRHVRDGLVDALDLALADDTIERVVLTGEGPAFCSGGDLDEFGDSTDVSTAHLIRLQRNAALRAHRVRERLEVRLHGACIGAGIEIPSFAARVLARDGVTIALPELAMGLVPGAGGTVGITGRVGRWRCAWLHLTGQRIGIDTALDWGLVDERC